MTTVHDDARPQTATVRTRGPFAALTLATSISVIGTAMTAIALPWLVLTVTGSAAQAGLVALAEMAPYVVVQAIGGPWVDRVGARRVCAGGNALAGVVVCAVPLLFVTAGAPLWVLCVLLAAAGVARGAADNATSGLLAHTVRLAGTPLERAAGLVGGAHRTGSLLGGVFAGILLTLAVPSVVVVIDGLTFLAAAALVLVIPRPAATGSAEGTADTASYFRRLGEGLRFLVGDRLVLATTLLNTTTNLLGAALGGVLLPAWVLDRQLSPGSLGAVFTALGLGGVLGSLAAAWLGPRLPRWAAYSCGFLLGGAPIYIVAALSTVVLPVLLTAFATGVFTGVLNPIVGAVQYERIPPQLLIRVLGAIKALAWVGVALGPLTVGLLLAVLDVTTVLWGCGIAYLAMTLAPFGMPVFRELDRRPSAPGQSETVPAAGRPATDPVR